MQTAHDAYCLVTSFHSSQFCSCKHLVLKAVFCTKSSLAKLIECWTLLFQIWMSAVLG